MGAASLYSHVPQACSKHVASMWHGTHVLLKKLLLSTTTWVHVLHVKIKKQMCFWADLTAGTNQLDWLEYWLFSQTRRSILSFWANAEIEILSSSAFLNFCIWRKTETSLAFAAYACTYMCAFAPMCRCVAPHERNHTYPRHLVQAPALVTKVASDPLKLSKR